MIHTTRQVLLVAATLLVPCAGGEGDQAVSGGEAVNVSLIQLIANGRAWNGRVVRLQGYCRLEFEDTALYFHKEDSDYLNGENAVWLRVGWPVPQRFAGVKEGYALVGGGHKPAVRGSLRRRVVCLEVHVCGASLVRRTRQSQEPPQAKRGRQGRSVESGDAAARPCRWP